MLNEIDKATRMFGLNNIKYPNKIIVGEEQFEKLKKEMHEKMAIGLKVNLKGEYISLFDMSIEIDYINKERLEIGYLIEL